MKGKDVSVPAPDDFGQDDVDNCAAVFARLAVSLNPKVDEEHAFRILRDFIVSPGMGLDTVEELSELILSTRFDPAIDTLH